MKDDAATRLLLQRGKLEKTCRSCGRWEAASPRCSWCHAEVTPADWYLNGVKAEREARIPVAAPANPPTELRDLRAWPKQWGPNPYAKRPTADVAASNTTPDASARVMAAQSVWSEAELREAYGR